MKEMFFITLAIWEMKGNLASYLIELLLKYCNTIMVFYFGPKIGLLLGLVLLHYWLCFKPRNPIYFKF